MYTVIILFIHNATHVLLTFSVSSTPRSHRIRTSCTSTSGSAALFDPHTLAIACTRHSAYPYIGGWRAIAGLDPLPRDNCKNDKNTQNFEQHLDKAAIISNNCWWLAARWKIMSILIIRREIDDFIMCPQRFGKPQTQMYFINERKKRTWFICGLSFACFTHFLSGSVAFLSNLRVSVRIFGKSLLNQQFVGICINS